MRYNRAMHVKSIHVYPVKGAGGVSLAQCALLPHGFAHDRCWMPVDAEGKAMLQWAHPKLAQVSVTLAQDGIILSAPQMQELHIATPGGGSRIAPLKIKKREMQAREAAPEAHEWFSSLLGAGCRLLYKEDAQSGGTPVHITTTASLADLNRRTGSETPMNRFRPNIVIETAQAWTEDAWHSLRIGEAELEIIKPCARCEVITTDQETGLRNDTAPLDTLRQFRLIRQADKPAIAFGLNATPLKTATIRLNDTVEILSRQDAPLFHDIT